MSELKGLGDFVAAVTTKLGVKPCPPCKQRQMWLNQKFSFSKPVSSSGLTLVKPNSNNGA